MKPNIRVIKSCSAGFPPFLWNVNRSQHHRVTLVATKPVNFSSFPLPLPSLSYPLPFFRHLDENAPSSNPSARFRLWSSRFPSVPRTHCPFLPIFGDKTTPPAFRISINWFYKMVDDHQDGLKLSVGIQKGCDTYWEIIFEVKLIRVSLGKRERERDYLVFFTENRVKLCRYRKNCNCECKL